MPKQIILLLDGTWNDSAFGKTDTNIVRIRELIARKCAASAPPLQRGAAQVDPPWVFYERGVGTGAFFDRWTGGLFGKGLPKGIRRAYRFLSFNYQPGDSVFIFGFSRGAYTARSLVGFIQAAGLLKHKHCTDDLEHTAWDYYRCPPSDRLSGIWSDLAGKVHDRNTFEISCLGVFDTVGALGIPLAPFKVFNRDKYEFHGVDLSSIVSMNLHAVAIDEHRVQFEASVWRRNKFKKSSSTAEQVWFSGVHADIGGGYIDEDQYAGSTLPRLDDISLEWMMTRLLERFPNFPISLSDCQIDTKYSRSWALAPQHDSRRTIYRLFPKAIRSISNLKVNCVSALFLAFGEINVTRDRHARPLGENVHISAILRLGEMVTVDKTEQKYLPKNLIAIIADIENFYKTGSHVGFDPVAVVGWNGEIIKRGTPEATTLLKEIAAAKLRLT